MNIAFSTITIERAGPAFAVWLCDRGTDRREEFKHHHDALAWAAGRLAQGFVTAVRDRVAEDAEAADDALLTDGEYRMHWSSKPAPFRATNVIPLAEANVDPVKIERLSPIIRNLLRERRIHSMSDISLAVAENRLDDDDSVDAFVLIANDIARSYGVDNLLAVTAIRDWAARHRGHLLQ